MHPAPWLSRLLSDLTHQDVRLNVTDDGHLGYDSPNELEGTEILEQLKKFKVPILRFLGRKERGEPGAVCHGCHRWTPRRLLHAELCVACAVREQAREDWERWARVDEAGRSAPEECRRLAEEWEGRNVAATPSGGSAGRAAGGRQPPAPRGRGGSRRVIGLSAEIDLLAVAAPATALEVKLPYAIPNPNRVEREGAKQ